MMTWKDFFKTLAALVALALLSLLMGCKTTYRAQYINPDSGATTTMEVDSYREFPGGIKIYYDRDRGTFTLEAGEVTNGSEVEAMRDVILGVLPLIPAPAAGGG